MRVLRYPLQHQLLHSRGQGNPYICETINNEYRLFASCKHRHFDILVLPMYCNENVTFEEKNAFFQIRRLVGLYNSTGGDDQVRIS